MSEANDSTWVFGYGSLIYKVDFPFLQQQAARINGWERRFWQGSHDHRGTPEAPGRVVTLIPSPDAQCLGVAYLVSHEVFEHLDHREKNGYERVAIAIQLEGSAECVEGVIYIAAAHNPAYLGPLALTALASHIAAARGPSGSNTEYVVKLAAALRELGDPDPHVQALDALLRETGPVHTS